MRSPNDDPPVQGPAPGWPRLSEGPPKPPRDALRMAAWFALLAVLSLVVSQNYDLAAIWGVGAAVWLLVGYDRGRRRRNLTR